MFLVKEKDMNNQKLNRINVWERYALRNSRDAKREVNSARRLITLQKQRSCALHRHTSLAPGTVEEEAEETEIWNMKNSEVQKGIRVGVECLGAKMDDTSTRWPSCYLLTFPSIHGVKIWPFLCK